METINAVWEHSYGEDCIPNFSANMEQPRHRWYEFKETLRSHVQCKWDRKDSSTSPWVTGIVQKLTAKQDTLWNANIPQMVSSYFYDMEEVLKQSYRIAKQNSQLWFVVSRTNVV